MENLWRKWYHGPNRMFHAFKRSTTNTHQSVKEDLLPQILNMRPDFRSACQICQNHQKSGDSQLSYQWKNHILITRFGPAKKMPTTHLTYSKGWTCSGLRLKATLNSKGAKAKGIRIRGLPKVCQVSTIWPALSFTPPLNKPSHVRKCGSHVSEIRGDYPTGFHDQTWARTARRVICNSWQEAWHFGIELSRTSRITKTIPLQEYGLCKNMWAKNLRNHITIVYDFLWHAHVGLHTWNCTSDRKN